MSIYYHSIFFKNVLIIQKLKLLWSFVFRYGRIEYLKQAGIRYNDRATILAILQCLCSDTSQKINNDTV